MKAVTIVGGGLAGLSLGIALRKKEVPVRVFEAGSYPRHRVCGEFINGVTRETLECLGIAEVMSDVQRLSSTKWYRGEEEIFSTTLDRPALGVSRYSLDLKLAELFEALGGVLETKSRQQISSREGLVWAAGRKANTKSPWLGLKAHVYGLKMKADLEMHLGSAGYVGMAPVEDGAVNVCGLFRRQSMKAGGSDLLWNYLRANELSSLAERLERGEMRKGSLTGVSAFQLGGQQVEEELCVLGDAESMIPPFTGNGMSMAFEAAEIASGVLGDYASGLTMWSDAVVTLRERLRERFHRRLTTAGVVHPFLFSDMGKMMLTASAKSGVLPFDSLSRMLR